MQDFTRMAAGGAALALLAAALPGCASIKDHRGYLADSVLVESVQPGIDNRVSVERTLGRPSLVSQFGERDWYYISMDTRTPPFRRTRTADQMVVRVRFDASGNVESVDRRGMEKVVRLDPDGHATPTLGRERTLLQDLFGNIGAVGAPGAPQGEGGAGPNGS